MNKQLFNFVNRYACNKNIEIYNKLVGPVDIVLSFPKVNKWTTDPPITFRVRVNYRDKNYPT